MSLVEEREDFVAGGEFGDLFAHGGDGAGAVGAGDDVVGYAEGVLAFSYDEVAVVEGGGVDWDGRLVSLIWRRRCGDLGRGCTFNEDISVTELRDGSLLVEFQVVEAALAGYGPLLHCLCHCGCFFQYRNK